MNLQTAYIFPGQGSQTPGMGKALADAFHAALLSEEGRAYQASRPGKPMMESMDEMGEFHRREYERFKRVAEAAGIEPQ